MQGTWRVDDDENHYVDFDGSFAFTGIAAILQDLQDRDWMMVRMPWYGEGAIVVNYDTRGAAQAMTKMPCGFKRAGKERQKIRQKRLDAGDHFVGHEIVLPRYVDGSENYRD